MNQLKKHDIFEDFDFKIDRFYYYLFKKNNSDFLEKLLASE